jgi:hypothetical protein
VGGGFVAFGVAVWAGARRDVAATGRLALAGDVAYVVATVALAPLVASSFTTLEAWLAVTVAV